MSRIPLATEKLWLRWKLLLLWNRQPHYCNTSSYQEGNCNRFNIIQSSEICSMWMDKHWWVWNKFTTVPTASRWNQHLTRACFIGTSCHNFHCTTGRNTSRTTCSIPRHDKNEGISKVDLDKQIGVVSSCQVCQSLRADPPTAQAYSWTYPSQSWPRHQTEFAGPSSNKIYFVLVDVYSMLKWVTWRLLWLMLL